MSEARSLIGTHFGPYEILEELGQGGMATVYRAHQETMGRSVAIKVLHTSLAGRHSALSRFVREARLIARLEHPHLLPVHDFDGTHEPPYLVLRYLEGASLKEALAVGQIPPSEALALLHQVAGALDYAHRKGVVHRDIKPSNILLDLDGNAFLTDFGIARLVRSEREEDASVTQTGSLVGTPAYMAPEQGMAEEIDHRADLYALGVVCFELLAGTPPFAGDNPLATILRHVNEPPPPLSRFRPELPHELEAVLTRALDKDPAKRFASAADLCDALEGALEAPPARDPSTVRHLISSVHRNPSPDRHGGSELLPPTVDYAAPAPPADPGSTAGSIETHRQVTVVFANLAETGELFELAGEGERAEELRYELTAIVRQRGGEVHRQDADSLLAIWGLESVLETDPEQALRASLALRHAVAGRFQGIDPVPMQIAVATGPVLVGVAKGDTHPTARGATTSLVKRLERASPAGSIVVEHETYRHVRGVFSFEEGDPLRVRGRRHPLETYRVRRAKPRAFRRTSRGVEGVETKMVGRQAELRLLQEAFWAAVEDREAQLVTVLGAPGVGKSRLLFELTDWSDLSEVSLWLLQGRATPETRNRPYGLLRDLLAFRFEIRDDDPPEEVREKLVAGTALMLGSEQPETREIAQRLGRLAGFEIGRGDEQEERFGDLAERDFVRWIRGACQRHPALIQLEDLQWADDASLDLLTRLLREAQGLPLLVVGSARPELEERRPRWGGDIASHLRIELRPLSRREARALVREILQLAPEVPDALRDLVVDRAEGNPFYLEELVKVLIEEHVILTGDAGWRIELDRIPEMPIPSTLTGLVQARLDGLFPAERLVLQRAAVIGRTFWDRAVAALQEADGIPVDVAGTLDSLTRRDLLREAEGSAFAGMREASFPSTLVRDVVLDTLPPALRRGYHEAAARWLGGVAGGRAAELAAVMAEHLERAGRTEAAVPHLREAAEKALAVSAFREAEVFLRRALDLSEGETPERPMLEIRLGETLLHLGRLQPARKSLESAMQRLEPGPLRAEALSLLAQVEVAAGNLGQAQVLFEESLGLAEEHGDPQAQARALYGLGDLAWRQNDLEEAERRVGASLELAGRAGLAALELYCVNRLGAVAMFRGDEAAAARWFERCRELAQVARHRDRLAAALGNLGVLRRLQGDLEGAVSRFREALEISEEIGDPQMAHLTRLNLGITLARSGAGAEARDHLAPALEFASQERLAPLALGALVAFAQLQLEEGRTDQARELLAVVEAHPERDADVELELELLRQRLRGGSETPPGGDAVPISLWDAVDQILRESA